MPRKTTHDRTAATVETTSSIVPATRMRAADHVFESLSRAILTGELAPGSVLATQRELSTQFKVSPLVVRQATHRLEELGLVRVRQGSTTVVLDPNSANDVRLIQLRVQLATPGDRFALAACETQALSTLGILALAERRISEPELRQLEELIDRAPDGQTYPEVVNFRIEFWHRIARTTRNPLIEQHVRSWGSMVRDIEVRLGGDPVGGVTRTFSKAPYRGVVRALRRRRGTAEFWLKVVEPMFDWTESHPAHALHPQKPASALKPSRAAQHGGATRALR